MLAALMTQMQMAQMQAILSTRVTLIGLQFAQPVAMARCLPQRREKLFAAVEKVFATVEDYSIRGGTDDTDADGSGDSIDLGHFDWAAVCTASCNVDGGVCLSVERRCFPQWREGVCHSGEKVCFAHQHLGDVEIL